MRKKVVQQVGEQLFEDIYRYYKDRMPLVAAGKAQEPTKDDLRKRFGEGQKVQDMCFTVHQMVYLEAFTKNG